MISPSQFRLLLFLYEGDSVAYDREEIRNLAELGLVTIACGDGRERRLKLTKLGRRTVKVLLKSVEPVLAKVRSKIHDKLVQNLIDTGVLARVNPVDIPFPDRNAWKRFSEEMPRPNMTIHYRDGLGIHEGVHAVTENFPENRTLENVIAIDGEWKEALLVDLETAGEER